MTSRYEVRDNLDPRTGALIATTSDIDEAERIAKSNARMARGSHFYVHQYAGESYYGVCSPTAYCEPSR